MKKSYILIICLILFIIIILLLKYQKVKEKIIEPKKYIEKKEEEIKKIILKEKIVKEQEKVEFINFDAFLFKIDKEGNIIWTKTYGYKETVDWIEFVIQLKNENFLILGRNLLKEKQINNIFLSILDKEGEPVLNQILNEKNTEVIKTEYELLNGKLLIGRTYDKDDKVNIYLTKIDEKGEYDWIRVIEQDFFDWGYYSLNTNEGNTFILGFSEEYKDIKDDICLIIKTKESQESKIFGGDDYDFGYSLIRTKKGFLITGTTFSFGSKFSDIYIINIDYEGNCVWARTIDGDGFDNGYSATENQGFVICGSTTTQSFGGFDVYLVKIDETGNVLWKKNYGYTYDDAGFYIEKTLDNCYIVGGFVGLKN